MSYCRWSSDGLECDIYAYQDYRDLYVIHVAGLRPLGPLAECPPWGLLLSDMDAWQKAYEAFSASLSSAARVPIGLPHDGETFALEDLDDFEAKLRELRALGYRFPDNVLDAIAEERIEWQTTLTT